MNRVQFIEWSTSGSAEYICGAGSKCYCNTVSDELLNLGVIDP